jgi:hypothetical protein
MFKAPLPLVTSILIGCATTPPALEVPSVSIARINPSDGPRTTAGTRLQIAVDYAWPGFQPPGSLVLSSVQPGKKPSTLRRVPLHEASGHVVLELMAVEMTAMPYAGPIELQVELRRWQRQGGWTAVKTSDKTVLTADLTDYNGQKLHFIPPKAGRELIAIDPREPPYSVSLPAVLNRDGMVVWGIFKTCVDSEAHVFNVSVLQSADAVLVDGDWMAQLRSWPHRPYLVDGAASPYCYPIRLEVRSVAP